MLGIVCGSFLLDYPLLTYSPAYLGSSEQRTDGTDLKGIRAGGGACLRRIYSRLSVCLPVTVASNELLLQLVTSSRRRSVVDSAKSQRVSRSSSTTSAGMKRAQ